MLQESGRLDGLSVGLETVVTIPGEVEGAVDSLFLLRLERRLLAGGGDWNVNCLVVGLNGEVELVEVVAIEGMSFLCIITLMVGL